MVRGVLQERFQAALSRIGVTDRRVAFEYPRDPRHGDYSTNIAMVLANEQKKNPRDLAQEIVAALLQEDASQSFQCCAGVDVAGPGFINITLSDALLGWELSSVLEHRERYGSSQEGAGKTVIDEYFQPNIAKPLHIGHVRSTVIGDSLKRVFEFLGYDVVSDSHIGDWGFQFGLLVWAYKEWGSKEDVEKDPIPTLLALYVRANKEMAENEEIRDKAKQEFALIESGDDENTELWKWFVDLSMKEFSQIHTDLDILPFDIELGESYYKDMMKDDLKMLDEKGLVVTGNDGELYVDLEDVGLGRAILVNSAGATMYVLRDLSTFRYRVEHYKFYRNLYVVDFRQSHHFRQVFAVMEKAGYGDAVKKSMHVSFGSMSSESGPFSTRKGNFLKLSEVVSELQKKASEVIDEKNPDLQDKETVVRSVALATLKFADLSHDRETDVTFRWDDVLRFEGRTGPYIQYTYTRIHNVLRKADYDPFTSHDSALIGVDDDRVRAVVLLVIRFPFVLSQVVSTLKPHMLAELLYELAKVLNTLYAEVPILKEEDDAAQKELLAVVAAGAQVLENGLHLLGIPTPPEM